MKHKVVPSKVISPAGERFRPDEKETVETMMEPFTEGLEVDAKPSCAEPLSSDAKSPLVATDAEGDTLVSEP